MWMELGIGIAALGCIGAGALSKYMEFKRETVEFSRSRCPGEHPPVGYTEMRDRAFPQRWEAHRRCLDLFEELSEPEPGTEDPLKLSGADG